MEVHFPALKQGPFSGPIILSLERDWSYVRAEMSPTVAVSSASEVARAPYIYTVFSRHSCARMFICVALAAPLFGSTLRSIVIVAVARALCICGVLATVGGRTRYGLAWKIKRVPALES